MENPACHYCGNEIKHAEPLQVDFEVYCDEDCYQDSRDAEAEIPPEDASEVLLGEGLR